MKIYQQLKSDIQPPITISYNLFQKLIESFLINVNFPYFKQ